MSRLAPAPSPPRHQKFLSFPVWLWWRKWPLQCWTEKYLSFRLGLFANLWRRACPRCLASPCKREWCLKPLFDTRVFASIETIGVMALVVQEALEVILNLEISPAFTLGVKVRAISSLTGAVITTLFAPASKWALALS